MGGQCLHEGAGAGGLQAAHAQLAARVLAPHEAEPVLLGNLRATLSHTPTLTLTLTPTLTHSHSHTLSWPHASPPHTKQNPCLFATFAYVRERV